MTFHETKSGQFMMKSKRVAVDPGMDFVILLYRLWAAHKYIGTLMLILQLWCWSLAIHHIKDAVALAKDFSELVKALSPL